LIWLLRENDMHFYRRSLTARCVDAIRGHEIADRTIHDHQ
jgi:hypothetical protein